MTTRDETDYGDASPSPIPQREEEVALLHELAEACTSLAIYLEAMRLMIDSNPQPSCGELRETVSRSINQSERAGKALQSLRALLRRRYTCHP